MRQERRLLRRLHRRRGVDTRAWSLGGELATVPFCLPDGTTYEQLGQAYLAWAERNSDRLDDLASVTVHEAMAAAAPC